MQRRRGLLHWLGRLRFLSPETRFEWYPPFRLMGVRVLELSEDWSHMRIRLPLTCLSANAAGNVFGGFQACLADPLPALACLKLFPGHRVATKKLELEFLRVGNSDLVLELDIDVGLQRDIRRSLHDSGRADPCFSMVYRRRDGKVCTRIRNTVAIRPQGYVSPLERSNPDRADREP